MFRKKCDKVTQQISRHLPFRKRLSMKATLSSSISTEILIDIFRCFSRKGLCQHIYRVNRQFYHLATSKNCVPVIHLIREDLHFFSTENQQTISIGRRYFVPWYHKDNQVTHSMPAKKFLKKMPCPDQFVRFEKVTIHRYLEEDEIKFLLKSRESFVECELELCWASSSETTNPDQNGYVLQNIFYNPSWLFGNGLINRKLLETDALLNCNKLEVEYERTWSEETVCMLLDWLKSIENLKSLNGEDNKKHLILRRYPVQRSIPMIHRLKKEFETVTMPSVEFVITFLICPSEWTNDQDLQGHEFSLDSNGTRLSLFQGEYTSVYRLWQRRILNEANDNAMLAHILNIPRESEKNWSKRHRNHENKYELYSYDELVYYG